MNFNLLSNTLTSTVLTKLKLETCFLENEKSHLFNLSKLILKLSESNEDIKIRALWQTKNFKDNKKTLKSSQDFVISYVITITFLKANTMIHVSDAVGNVKWFCSSGSINITGKRKKQRRSVILKLIIFLFKKVDFLGNKPVALHLNNVSSYQTFIVKKLKKEIFIKVVKSFNQIPYNGCRQKKIRRKKYSKNFR